MADVARRAGVSRALVSLVFRDQPGASERTRQRVLRVADQLGYRPDTAARMLASRHSRTLGVMLTVHQPFQADLVEAIYPEAERLGYEVLLSATAPSRDERKAVESLLSHRCEALILLGPRGGSHQLDELGQRAVVAVVGRRATGARVDSVHTAEDEGVRQAVDYLAELGHRRIVHIDGGDGPGAPERRDAYLTAMRARGLAAEARVIPGAHTEDAGVKAGRSLLGERQLPTAVLAGNDRCALGLMRTLAQAGLDVPRDVSVVGYDDSHVSHLAHVDLTTIRQDVDRMAEQAVRLAVARLEDSALPPREVVLEPKLVVRGTTGPPAD
ncbi:LacI family transcriptional regulator [Saccharopolyspora subtropica]|uniref:LacI family DNA-binding transcriptional regulator n=1 Tax=Saccharopolyspora thermophila TaxID=89367 RepID=A0A917JU12_9PSEU|nr:LacI family DNA-binding transcriptional regulator [Saccharopolyspora subtropica]GGI87108.1 LacI family transcriptional regulator [Saccharopolyspora subtropica]